MIIMLIAVILLAGEVILKENRLNLKQVVVLGRHGIRTPLISNVAMYTPKVWPGWKEEPSYLTEKGGKLEEYMGEYFAAWLRKEALLQAGCPKKDAVYIYANSVHRTKESAKAFVEAAFKNCNVSVFHKDLDPMIMDPTFHPILHNASKQFLEDVANDMRKRIEKSNLNEAYAKLDEILDIANSVACKNYSICSLVDGKDDIISIAGDEPDLRGPLAVGNKVVDFIVMSYYSGFDMENVAWGKISDNTTFETITKITKENQNVRFNSTLIGRDSARPLMLYMFSIFEKLATKFAFFAGHDSNISSLMAVFGFKSYVLKDTFENTPVGGKLVFERWHDVESHKDLLKIEYIYQTAEQLRNGTPLSLRNPPKRQTLELTRCKIDANGFCAFADFVSILKSENLLNKRK